MNHLRRSLTLAFTTTIRLTILALAIHGGLDLARDALAQEEQHAYMPYAEQSGSLADRVAELEYLLEHVSRDGDTLVVSGANLQVVNGTGTTDGEPNGLGNVVVGYNESRFDYPQCINMPDSPDCVEDRSGSHMVVVGTAHNFMRFGGLIAGVWNESSADWASVSGGSYNEASGFASSVTGGQDNRASGFHAVVAAGNGNTASRNHASISGGIYNTASGLASMVSGGRGNEAQGLASTVSGGENRSASRDYNWAAGSLLEER